MRNKLFMFIMISALFIGAFAAYSGTAHASTATHTANTHASVAALTCPPTIREWTSRHDLVVWLQSDLDVFFGYNLTVDGVFGPNTLAAVRDFQGKYAPPVDGIVGTITWTALGECY